MSDDKRPGGDEHTSTDELEATIQDRPDGTPADTAPAELAESSLEQTLPAAAPSPAATGQTGSAGAVPAEVTNLEGTLPVGPDPADDTAEIADDEPARPVWGLMVEFDDIPALIAGAEKVRDAGFRRWDCHTPFPVHGLNDAMGLRLTKLPLVTLAGGLIGGGGALLMQWWMNAYSYPINISGKPLFSVPANIPVMFEATILLAAISTFVAMLAFNNLPMHHHPLMTHERFRRTTDDRFFISIEAADPRFELDAAMALAGDLGGRRVEVIEGEE